MIRQRCLIGAMVRQAEPLTVLKHFQELASATKKLAATDIPRSVLPDMITLGDRMHGGGSIRSIAFVPPVIVTGNPNYARIRALAKAALTKPAAKPSPAPTTGHPRPTPTSPRPSSTPRATSAPVDVDSSCGLG